MILWYGIRCVEISGLEILPTKDQHDTSQTYLHVRNPESAVIES